MVPATKKTKREDSDGASPSKRRDWGQYTHLPLNQTQLSKNGRQKGRNLITWNRPRMYEKLLLHIQYECARQRVDIPWHHIAHRLNPGSSGNAVSQQLVRLRQTLVTEGHLVPPPLPKPGAPKQDPKVRGFVRKFLDDSGDVTTTEAVGWNEPMEDRRRNLADAADFIDDEDESMTASMTPDNTMDWNDFEDAEEDDDTGDDVGKPGAKGKGKDKMPVKRQSSVKSDCRGGSKKIKRSARKARAAAALKKGSEFQLEGSASEADEDEDENNDDIVETVEDAKVKKDETFADESFPSRNATPHIQPVSANGLPDPFTAAAHTEPTILPAIPMALASFAALEQQQQSTAGSSASLQPTTDHQHGGVMATPSPIRSIAARLMISPIGQAWTVPAFNLNGASLQAATTPMGPLAFATVNSSPANFDFENATPRTAAAMRSHLDEWNAEELPSMFSEADKFEEQLQRSVEKRKREA